MSAPRGNPVLVIDDDPLVMRTICRMVEMLGHPTTCACTLEEARVLLLRGSFAAVVCDHSLDDGSGLTFASELRRVPAAPPLILISGDHGVLDRARTELGCVALAKPMTRAELGAALLKVIDRDAGFAD